jgi:arsenate reductase
MGQGQILAKSAGSQAVAQVHPMSIRYLSEAGIPTQGLRSESWHEYEHFAPDLVVTVCDSAAAESCPVWFGNSMVLHWRLTDPSKVHGSQQDVAEAFKHTITVIQARVKQLLNLDLFNQDLKVLKGQLQNLVVD